MFTKEAAMIYSGPERDSSRKKSGILMRQVGKDGFISKDIYLLFVPVGVDLFSVMRPEKLHLLLVRISNHRTENFLLLNLS